MRIGTLRTIFPSMQENGRAVVDRETLLGLRMKAYKNTEKAKHELAKQRSLQAIDARLTRHKKLTQITLILVLILVGLSLALLATYLVNS